MEALVAEAQEYELDAVFAFTYVAEFFNRVGFDVVERGVLPLKAWKDCLRCPKEGPNHYSHHWSAKSQSNLRDHSLPGLETPIPQSD